MPETGCTHDQLEGLAAVQCRFTASLTQPASCDRDQVPPVVSDAVARAQNLVDRAGGAASSRQARVRLRKAIRQLAKARRIVRRQRNLEFDCLAAVAANLEQVRLEAKRLAREL
jgi:hypothetical protein